jgi:hypothetical protein
MEYIVGLGIVVLFFIILGVLMIIAQAWPNGFLAVILGIVFLILITVVPWAIGSAILGE